MQLKRWLTALSLTPLLLLIIGYGSEPVFFGLIVTVITLSLHEFYSLVLGHGHGKEKTISIILGALLAYGFVEENTTFLFGITACIVIFLLLYFLICHQDITSTVPNFGNLLMGLFYISFLLSHLLLIRELPFGKQWVFFVLTVTFLGDTCSYYGGTYLGRHKLYLRISPGKTIEGAGIGLQGGVTGALVFWRVFLSHVEMYHIFILALSMGIIGQGGDLCESMIKRSQGVKDSGGLLPGHGGVLDRIDSLLFSAPFFYYYNVMFL